MRQPTWFLSRRDTNRPVQAQNTVRSWKFWIFRKKRNCTIRVAKTKAPISYAVTTKMACVFVFAYAECRFSHDAA